jgi:hypothetical protein
VAAHRETIIEQFTRQAPGRGAAESINDAALPRSFPANAADAAAVRRIFAVSLADDRLGVGTRVATDRIEYAHPPAALVSRRCATDG